MRLYEMTYFCPIIFYFLIFHKNNTSCYFLLHTKVIFRKLTYISRFTYDYVNKISVNFLRVNLSIIGNDFVSFYNFLYYKLRDSFSNCRCEQSLKEFLKENIWRLSSLSATVISNRPILTTVWYIMRFYYSVRNRP